MAFCIMAVPALAQTTCADYSWSTTIPWSSQGTAGHSSGGYHQIYFSLFGECLYSSVDQPTCGAFSQSNSVSPSFVTDTCPSGSSTNCLPNPLYFHQITGSSSGGASTSNGAVVSTTVTGAGTASACYRVLGCGLTITFNATASGVGTTVNFPTTNLNFNQSYPSQVICSAVQDPQYAGGGGGLGFGGCTPNNGCEEGPTPIIIETGRQSWDLTSAADGVVFDFWGDGHPIGLSWTAATSGNAFLACLDCWKDLPDTGLIESGKNLFGNLTEQPPSDHRNGFLALAEFDKPENGGNGDGIIDKHDAVYSKLLLWVDENHDGISQPNELHTLPELGVFSIALQYHSEPFVDQYGNRFRYRGTLNPDPMDGQSNDGRYIYDVIFVPVEKATAAKR